MSLLGLFGINSSKSESQFLKIENSLKHCKVSELKLNPLRRIEFDSNFISLNKLVKNKKYTYEKFLFLTKNGRWEGFIDENILKTVSIKKWESAIVDDFKKPINSLKSININTALWKAIDEIEKTKEDFLLVLNNANIPLGIIDKPKIGYFVLNKLGITLPSEIANRFNNRNHYPLGLELKKIIDLMKKKGDIE